MSRLRFSAVVGQDEAKLALVLAAATPTLGGVLLRGDKGGAKTTLARGLATLLASDAPFIELPLGAGEDRVLGSIDVAALLEDGTHRFSPGLLAAAHGGVLYVDEVNLLADHLVDALLDAAASGEHRVERDGVSHVHAARFVLVASMNPEEGELRPQLLDRFGLCVEMHTSPDPVARAIAVRRQLEHDRGRDDEAAAAADAALAARVAMHVAAQVSDDVVDAACRLAVAVGAEGLRADLMLCRAAAALAGWEDRAEAARDDVARVAPFVLGHRRRRRPFDEPTMSKDDLDDALEEAGLGSDAAPNADESAAAGSGPESEDGQVPTGGRYDRQTSPGPARRDVVGRGSPRRSSEGRSGRSAFAAGDGGRIVGEQEWRPGGAVAPRATAVAAVTRAAGAGAGAAVCVAPGDLRSHERVQSVGSLVVVVVDTSGSMGAARRVDAATGAVLGILADAYQRRDRVALVTCGGAGASVVLRPTGSVEVAKARLADLPVGGPTPLADALVLAYDLLLGKEPRGAPVLVLITDGRATQAPAGQDPVRASLDAAEAIGAAGVRSVVVDAETSTPRLGLAAGLADALRGELRSLDDLDLVAHLTA